MPTAEQALRTLGMFGACLLPGCAQELSFDRTPGQVRGGGRLDNLLCTAVGPGYQLQEETEGRSPHQPYPGQLLLLKPRPARPGRLPLLVGAHRPHGVTVAARVYCADHPGAATSWLGHGAEDVIVAAPGTAMARLDNYLRVSVVPDGTDGTDGTRRQK